MEKSFKSLQISYIYVHSYLISKTAKLIKERRALRKLQNPFGPVTIVQKKRQFDFDFEIAKSLWSLLVCIALDQLVHLVRMQRSRNYYGSISRRTEITEDALCRIKCGKIDID